MYTLGFQGRNIYVLWSTTVICISRDVNFIMALICPGLSQACLGWSLAMLALIGEQLWDQEMRQNETQKKLVIDGTRCLSTKFISLGNRF